LIFQASGQNYFMDAKTAIILVTHNGEKYLPACLQSVFEQSCQNWHLYILDNASGDRSLEIASGLADGRGDITIVGKEKINLGFAAGYNKLMRQAQGEYFLLLNQDVVMEKNYLAQLIDFLDEHAEAGAVIGKILRLTGSNKTDIIDTAGLQVWRSGRITDSGAGSLDRGQFDAMEEVFGVSGCLPLYRRQAMEQAGYFDEKFFCYKEDVDLAFRLQAFGWRSFRAGSAVAWHARGVGGGERKSLSALRLERNRRSANERFLSYRNHWLALIKNFAPADFFRYGVFIFYYELKKFLYAVFFEPKLLRAWIEIVRQWPVLWAERKKIKPKSIRKWIKK